MTDRARFLKKKKIGCPKLGFLLYSPVWLLVFLDSLQQCLTCSRSKIHEQSFWGPKFGPKGPK